MGWWDNKFEVGDIIRNKENKKWIGRVCKVEHKEDYDDSGRYRDKYEWYEYSFEDGTVIKSYDSNKWEILFKEIGPEQINEYDKVLIKNGTGLEGNGYWMCDFAAGWTNENSYYEKRLMTISQPNVKEIYYNIIPYNSETKKLIGTNLNIPKYYYYPNQIVDLLKLIFDNPDNFKSIDDILDKLRYRK